MTLDETMGALRSAGTEQTRKVYRRHGAGDNQFGVKFADLAKLAKKIKTDTELARSLWQTGNSDARALATMIAGPNELTAEELQSWVGDVNYYVLADLIVRHVAARRADSAQLMLRWIESSEEFEAQCGWDLVAQLAMNDPKYPDSYFASYVERIERDIHSRLNRVRHAMNGALIAIGLRNDKLRKLATAAAKRIGKVEVDHGETGCKTPDACAYIRKALDYRATKARKAAG